MNADTLRRTMADAAAALTDATNAAGACECRPGSVAVLRLDADATTPAARRLAEQAAGVYRQADGGTVCEDCGGLVVCVLVERRQPAAGVGGV